MKSDFQPKLRLPLM